MEGPSTWLQCQQQGSQGDPEGEAGALWRTWGGGLLALEKEEKCMPVVSQGLGGGQTVSGGQSVS